MKNADAQSGASANVDSSRTYDAFGNLTGSSGTWSGPFGYAGGFGYQEDPDHGLRLLGHRYYDSSTGRFISKDPAGAGRNWYGYCANNPASNVDPLGLDHFVIAVGGGNDDELAFPARFILLADQMAEFLRSNGHTVTILYGPSRSALEQALRRADALIIIAHGTEAGADLGVQGSRWKLCGAGLLSMRKGKKLKLIVSYACTVLSRDGLNPRAAWLDAADRVYGFDNVDSHVFDMLDGWREWLGGTEVWRRKGIPKGLPRRGGKGAPLTPSSLRNPLPGGD